MSFVYLQHSFLGTSAADSFIAVQLLNGDLLISQIKAADSRNRSCIQGRNKKDKPLKICRYLKHAFVRKEGNLREGKEM